MTTTRPLEQRISSALSSDAIAASELAQLVDETERTITKTDAIALAEKRKALDPALSPDPIKAREAMQSAEFSAARLRTVLPRLQARYQELMEQERRTQWRERHDTLKVKRDALAAELAEFYPAFVSKLTDLLTRIGKNDTELSRLHGARPSGVGLHLLGAEAMARKLENFSLSQPSIAQQLKLPDWYHSDQLAWPKLVPLNPMVIAPQVGGDPRVTSDHWWESREQRAEAHRAESGRVATFYDEQQRQREASEKMEGSCVWHERDPRLA